MIAQIIFEILVSWVAMGLATFILLDIGLNIAILCEKISDFLKEFAKYFRARFNQP